MDWIGILILLGLGILLIVLELIFVPGTTVIGIFGLVLTGFGVGAAYYYYNATTGHIVLASTATLLIVSLIYAVRSGTWTRFSHKGTHQAKVNEDYGPRFEVGAQGVTISSLRPIGKAEIKGQIIEVRTQGDYLETATTVEVIKIDGKRIYVSPIV